MTQEYFVGQDFKSRAHPLKFQTKEVPVEDANSISVVERCYQLLIQELSIIKKAPDTNDSKALQMAD